MAYVIWLNYVENICTPYIMGRFFRLLLLWFHTNRWRRIHWFSFFFCRYLSSLNFKPWLVLWQLTQQQQKSTNRLWLFFVSLEMNYIFKHYILAIVSAQRRGTKRQNKDFQKRKMSTHFNRLHINYSLPPLTHSIRWFSFFFHFSLSLLLLLLVRSISLYKLYRYLYLLLLAIINNKLSDYRWFGVTLLFFLVFFRLPCRFTPFCIEMHIFSELNWYVL